LIMVKLSSLLDWGMEFFYLREYLILWKKWMNLSKKMPIRTLSVIRS
jgi:hypothetical protein